MKISPTARNLIRIKLSLICLAVLLVATVELGLAQTLTSHVGRSSVTKLAVPPVPVLDCPECLAGLR